ncbi:MAG: UvrD-helicase domain-containing protein, partial [Propionibacteriaceae bacterium]|nr:UvrD-helicase domain-containing protein [Propionibacteriaceae bacterium]
MSGLPKPGETLVIEASAGTGKTWRISELASRFIAERGTPVSQIAIVTFSAAAAAEVENRTRTRLQADAQAATGRTRSRLESALADFDLAPIMTTHGFCDRLLSQLGILADHDPTDTLATDLGDLATQACADHFLRLRRQGQLRFTFDQALAWVRAALFAPGAPVVPAGTDAARFTDAVRDLVEQRKRRAGVYTFDDMLTRCRDTVVDPVTGPPARARLAGLYPVVLVDEFQDTDTIQ